MTRTTTKGDVITGKKPVSRQIEQKGVSNMEQTQNKFNVFNYTYYILCRAYLDSGSQNEFTVKLRRLYDTEFNGVKYEGSQKVLGYLNKLGGLKVDTIRQIEEFDEMGKRTIHYEVKIKDFDIKVKAKSNKTGNEYNVLQNALGRAMLAA